jgi:hypothetical protein
MTDLVEFLRARLDDDEAYARNAFGDHNDADPEWREIWSGELSLCADDRETVITGDSQVSRFMERFDPARVLREVEAKRQIISEYERYAAERRRAMNGWDNSEPSLIIKALAAVYADHPDYQQAWNLNQA